MHQIGNMWSGTTTTCPSELKNQAFITAREPSRLKLSSLPTEEGEKALVLRHFPAGYCTYFFYYPEVKYLSQS